MVGCESLELVVMVRIHLLQPDFGSAPKAHPPLAEARAPALSRHINFLKNKEVGILENLEWGCSSVG